MPSSYPSQIAIFPTHVNITEIIDAAHPNNIQNEVVAIETILGTNPNASSIPSPGGTFDATGTTFTSVDARLKNIETGVVSDAHSQYLRKAGDSGNVITPILPTVKGLVIKGAVGQTANLAEWQTPAGVVVTSIDKDGNLIGTASGNVALSTVTNVGDLIVGNGAGSVTRLGIGLNKYILASNGTSPYWTSEFSVQGPQGTQGLQGTQGIQGVQGVYGIQGPTGIQGIQGLQGLDGAYAAQGVQGPAGPVGPLDPLLASLVYV